MKEARRSIAAAQLLDLRTPLSRIALAASQLARETTRPVAQAQAAGIAEAIRDLDLRIERILPLLVELRSDARDATEVAETLAQLQGRLAAAVTARDIRLRVGAAPDPPVCAEPNLVRRAAVVLLRAGAAWVGTGGRLVLGATGDAEHPALALEGRRSGASAVLADEREAASAVHAFAELHGAHLEWDVAAKRLVATLWLCA